jgi:biopolymer transport protein ExbB
MTTTPDLVAASAVAAASPLATAPEQGFVHFMSQTDAVGQGLFVILVIMSVLSWALIVTKGVALFKRQRRSRAFLAFFWNATSLEAVQQEIARSGVTELEEAGSAQEFLTRTIKKVLDEDTMRMESGLSVLATIGATAPFVGLFGTVWGVYHALLAIGASGAGTLDKVAGPVGEALIMTGVGLAVAIPAVMGYNWLARSNRVWAARLDAFAFELFTFLSTGQTLKGSGQSPS